MKLKKAEECGLDCRYNGRWRDSQYLKDNNAFRIRERVNMDYCSEAIWQAPRREDGEIGKLVAAVRDSVLRDDPNTTSYYLQRVTRVKTAQEMTSLIWEMTLDGLPTLYDLSVERVNPDEGPGERPAGLYLQPLEPWQPDTKTLLEIHRLGQKLQIPYDHLQFWQGIWETGKLLSEGTIDPEVVRLQGDTSRVWDRQQFQQTYSIAGLWKGLPDTRILWDSPEYWNLLERLFGLWWDQWKESLKIYIYACLLRTFWWYMPDDQTSGEDVVYWAVEALLPDYLQGLVLESVNRGDVQDVREMAETMRRVMHQAVQRGSVYTEKSRRGALVKLEQMEIVIGLPHRMYRMESVPSELLQQSFWVLWREIHRHYWKVCQKLLQIDLPKDYISTDRESFGHIVNAFYLPTSNTVLIPPSIIGAPFCCRKDPWVKYGSLGVIIGHEICHALDIHGSRYDASGRYRLWWDLETKERYYHQLSKMIRHYASLRLAHQSLSWRMTTGEDFSDVCGIQLALAACREKHGGGEPEDWRSFFRSWSQTMRSNRKGESLQLQLSTDVHSPGQIRAEAPFSHIELFYRAYDLQPGEPGWLDPSDRAFFVSF